MENKQELSTIVWESNLRRTAEENKKVLGSNKKSYRSANNNSALK